MIWTLFLFAIHFFFSYFVCVRWLCAVKLASIALFRSAARAYAMHLTIAVRIAAHCRTAHSANAVREPPAGIARAHRSHAVTLHQRCGRAHSEAGVSGVPRTLPQR